MAIDFVECHHDSANLKQVWFALAALAILLLLVLASMGQEEILKASARVSGGFLVYSPNAARSSSYRSFGSSPFYLCRGNISKRRVTTLRTMEPTHHTPDVKLLNVKLIISE